MFMSRLHKIHVYVDLFSATPLVSFIKRETGTPKIENCLLEGSKNDTPIDIERIRPLSKPPTPPCKSGETENDDSERLEEANAIKKHLFDSPAPAMKQEKNLNLLDTNLPKDDGAIEEKHDVAQDENKIENLVESKEEISVKPAANFGTPLAAFMKRENVTPKTLTPKNESLDGSKLGTPADIELIKPLTIPPTPPMKPTDVERQENDADVIKKHLFEEESPSLNKAAAVAKLDLAVAQSVSCQLEQSIKDTCDSNADADSLPMGANKNVNKVDKLDTMTNDSSSPNVKPTAIVKPCSEMIEDKPQEEAKPKRKVLPPKPWLKKRKAKPAEQEEQQPLPKSNGYNLDFLDSIDDPNFNPFATKSKVVNDGEDQPIPKPASAASYNLDFLDKLDDPNFNPFETKTKVISEEILNDVIVKEDKITEEIIAQPAEEIVDDTTVDEVKLERECDKDSTPEFERAEKEIGQLEQDNSNILDDIIDVSKLEKSEQEIKSPEEEEEPTLLLPSQDPPKIKKHIPEVQDVQIQPPKKQEPEAQLLIPIETKAKAPAEPSRVLSDKVKDELARNELFYQAQLLEKDKELHAKEKEIQGIDQEVAKLKLELRSLSDGNVEMMKVVQEYEKTISEIISDRERERVCNEIEKEKLARDRDQTLDDLHSAERAFNDVHRKYERTKDVIAGFKKNEDNLKECVTELATKLKKSEERFENLRVHAEDKLNE